MKSFRLWVFVALVVALAIPPALSAQGIYGSLRGEVKDQTGAVVPGAKVTITNEDTGVSVEVETTSAGSFFVSNLLAAKYTVAVEATGFKRLVRKGVEVRTNQVSEVSLSLELGAVAQTVEVVAGAEMIKTTTSDITQTYGSRTVSELPNFATLSSGGGSNMLRGDPRNLAIGLPGVTSQPGGVVGEGGSIGGNRPRDNNFVLDGVDNNDVAITGQLQPVIQDAVEEFTLISNQFSAEYGHSTAGQFIITTKSGTNDLHGRAWWFVQNKKLDALDNLTDAAIRRGDISRHPRRDYDRLGGQLGGPIKKDKWFLFGAFEYQAFGNVGIPTVQVSAPTAAGYTTLGALPGVSPVALAALQTHVPAAAGATGTVLVGVTPIPIGPLAVSVLNTFRAYDWQLNTDYVTKRHRFAGRFLFNRVRAPDVFEGEFPEFVGTNLTDNRSVQFSDVFTPTPRLINELRLGYRRNSFALAVPNVTAPGGLDVFPNLEIDELNINMGPDGNAPQFANQNIYQFVDQVAYVRGKHTFKAGIDLRNWISPNEFLPRERGEYDWSTLATYLADGVPDGRNGGLRGVGSGFFALNQHAIYGFIQDDWRVLPHLTLNLGMRYEWSSVARDNAMQNLNAISNLPGVFVFRTPKSDKNNWSPRIGFAWDVFGNHKTAVRGGFGVAYDVIFGNLPLLQLPPQLQTELDASSNCPDLPAPPPWCSGAGGFIATGGLPQFLPVQCSTTAECRGITQAFVPDQISPKTLTWSLAIQREVYKDWSVELRYVGTHGLELPMQLRRNARIPIELPSPVQGLIAGSLPVFTSPSQVPANMAGALSLFQICDATSLAGGSCGRRRFFRGDGFNGNVTAFDPVGTSIYHGGSISVEHRFSRGFFFRGSYTFSKNIDLITNELFTSFLNPRRVYDHVGLGNNRGLSDLDRKHHFALTWMWDLPKYSGESRALKGLLNGWEFTGTYLAETGQPVTILNPDDMNGNGDFAGDRAIFNPAGPANTGATSSWVCTAAGGATFIAPQFDPSCFAAGVNVVGYVADANARFIAVGPGTQTNLGRNTFRSPGLNNFNFSISKKTYWNADRGRYIQFRVDLLNAFNHPQYVVGGGSVFINTGNSFNFPYATPGFPSFLDKRASFSSGNRFIQLGLKVVF